jgi:hypothetical protein
MSYNNASIYITPNGFKAGKLYAVKGADATCVRATSATRVNANGLIETVASNVPRIDYTDGGCPSILVEGQRTNLLTNSDGLITTYPTRDGNIVQAATPINGFVNSVEFQNNLTNSYLYKTFTAIPTTTYVFSVFVQMNDNSIPNPGLNVASSDFSLVISGEFATNLNVQKIGNSNVYRVSGRFTAINVNANHGVLKFNTQTAKGFKVTGYQLETASYATSYIKTTTAAVTRNADVITLTPTTGLTEIKETFENGTTNVITTIPSTYTMSQGRIKKVVMK